MTNTFKLSSMTKSLVLAGCAILTTACIHDNTDDELVKDDYYAVVSTRASDYSAGDYTLIDTSTFSTRTQNAATGSDNVISTNEDDIYQIGRYGLNNISKFNISAPSDQIWQYSTNDDVENAANSNPYKIVFANDQKAYIIRYGTDKIWVVNPLAETSADFKTGEIDLSAYADADGATEASDALVINGKLYVIMQRLDTTDGYKPGDAYLAVFDTSDDSEVATNTDSSTPKGVKLTLKNPNNIEYLSSNNTLYISAIGRYEASYIPRAAEYTGGIEAINLSDYSSSVVVDDGDDTTHPYGNITNVAVLNSTRGYFIGYAAFGDNSLYEFNPSDGTVSDTALISNKDLADIEIGPKGDLWVANAGESGVTVISTVDNSVKKALVSTELVPMNIEFVTVESEISFDQ